MLNVSAKHASIFTTAAQLIQLCLRPGSQKYAGARCRHSSSNENVVFFGHRESQHENLVGFEPSRQGLRKFGRTRVASRNHPRELRERRRPSSDAFCRPPDTAKQRRVTEVDSLSQNERRRKTQTRHSFAAAHQKMTDLGWGKVKQFRPFSNERIAFEMLSSDQAKSWLFRPTKGRD
jgi:hypothetical protein